MGLLDHLWDDTVAGPLPENGLGKLRKNKQLNVRPVLVKDLPNDQIDVVTPVTRSIMIMKPPGYTDSPPVSPAGTPPPISPFSGSRDSYRFRRRSTSDAFEKAGAGGPRAPTSPYDV